MRILKILHRRVKNVGVVADKVCLRLVLSEPLGGIVCIEGQGEWDQEEIDTEAQIDQLVPNVLGAALLWMNDEVLVARLHILDISLNFVVVDTLVLFLHPLENLFLPHVLGPK